jgi:hypothetical protein
MQAEGLEVVVSCFWASSEGHGGPELHPAAMLRFGQLNIPIRFDIYFEGED